MQQIAMRMGIGYGVPWGLGRGLDMRFAIVAVPTEDLTGTGVLVSCAAPRAATSCVGELFRPAANPATEPMSSAAS